MFFRLGFLLVLAAAANGQEWFRSPRPTASMVPYQSPKWELPTPTVNDLSNLDEKVILDWVPVYGNPKKSSAIEATQQPSLLGDWDFKCPKSFSFYRYKHSCDIYVECRNFQPTRKVCPDGMYVKENPIWSEDPCAYPPEAKCLNRENGPNSEEWFRQIHFTTPRPKPSIVPIYQTPKWDLPTPTVNDPSNLGEKVIIDWEPVYGYRNKSSTSKVTQQPSLSGDWDYKCPKRYSLYRYQQSCDIYVECRNFQPTRKVCPDGMHVKENLRWSEYPCAYPPEAKCLNRENGLPARPTAECPHQFGLFPITTEKYSTHSRCNSYISCSSGVAHLMNCSFGLVFNPEINLCDWPEQVPSCQDEFNFHCPVPHLGEEDMVVNYRLPTDGSCRAFYSCSNGNYRLQSCDEGMLFDHRIGRCVEYDDYICETDKPISNIYPQEELFYK